MDVIISDRRISHGQKDVRVVKKKRVSILLFFGTVLLSMAGCAQLWQEQIEIDGVRYPAETREWVQTDPGFSDYAALRQFRQLRTVDLTIRQLDAAEYETIHQTLGGQVEIIRNAPFDGEYLITTAPAVRLSHEPTAQNIDEIAAFTHLHTITVKNSPITDSLMSFVQAARDENPGVKLECATSVYGVPVNEATEALILDNISIDDLTPLKLALELFPGLKTVEMNECGLSDDIMGQLREDYPEVHFVWTIHFLIYSMRTDAQCFSTLVAGGEPRGSEEEFAPIFRYCTELRALDLGHQYISDISEIRHLTKLQTLILADNRISDISPLEELHDLNFVELFQNQITDVTPLTKLAHLEDLNIMYNGGLENPTELVQCRSLRRLYIAHCGLSAADRQTLMQGLPEDCELNTTNPNCVHGGWRTPEKVTAIRKTFKYWRKVKEYRRWDDVEFE